MGVKIFIQNLEVLDLQNSSFGTFYEDLLNLLQEKEISISLDLCLLMDELYSGCFGVGLDIAQYLKNKEDTILFASLVKSAIEKQQNSSHPFDKKIKTRLENFYQSIIIWADSFS
jgi:hypothetical protein